MIIIILIYFVFFVFYKKIDVALVGSLKNRFHVVQDQDQRAKWTAPVQQWSAARTG